MYYHDMDSEFYEIQDNPIFYYLLTGLSYREIGIRFYYHNTNKVVYQVRKLMKRFSLANRRHLAYFAVKNHLINTQKLDEYIND